MIADDGQFKLRRERKVVLPHKVRRDAVAAGHLFDARLCPRAAFLGFARGYKSRALKHGDVSGMLI